MDAAHAKLARDLRVCIRHRNSAAFVPRGDKLGTLRNHCIGDCEIAAADQAEDVPWAAACERPTNGLRDQHLSRH
jgi:hypothetical protein